MSRAVTRQYRAARLSTSLVRVIFQGTRSEELHLDQCVKCSTYRERPYEARCQAQARNRHYSGPRARIEVILWRTRSWLSRAARIRCERELYRPSYTPETAYRVLGGLHERHGDVTKRPWDASARRHMATCSFERWTGRIEHLAGALCKSHTDTFDRISRGHGVEGHEHGRLQRRIDSGQDARRKRDPGTARAHALGLRWYFDAHARSWVVQLGSGANGSSTGRLILRKPRHVFSGVLPERRLTCRKRPWDACALLLTAHYVYGPCGGLFEHATQALRKSTHSNLTKLPWEGVPPRGRRTAPTFAASGCNRRVHALPLHDHDWFGRKY